MLLRRVIDLSVERRGFVRVMQNDPVVVRLLGEHEPFQAFMSELYATLLDGGDEIEARISAAFVTAAIASTTVSPLVEDIDTETLRATMTELTERMLKLAPLNGAAVERSADRRLRAGSGPTTRRPARSSSSGTGSG